MLETVWTYKTFYESYFITGLHPETPIGAANDEVEIQTEMWPLPWCWFYVTLSYESGATDIMH